MISKINSYSKEAIKARMLQNATKIWGLKSISSIDPFVKLLIDAFSTEIFKLSNNLQTTQSRIVEKLSKLLTPSIHTYPQPSHAIGITFPIESKEVLEEYSEFSFKRLSASTVKGESDKNIDVVFTPIDTVELIRMQVYGLLTHRTCFTIDEQYQKIPIERISQGVSYNSLWIAIDASDYEEQIPEKLCLYCANPAFEEIDFVYKLLPFTKAQCSGRDLTVQAGYSYEFEQEFSSEYQELFYDYTSKTQIQDNIKRIYNHQFIELTGFSQGDISEDFPEKLFFLKDSETLLDALKKKKMIWVELSFPTQFSTDIIEGFSVLLNAFPIYNRGWRKEEGSLDIMGNNIPLKTDNIEHFLYIDKVEDNIGNTYQGIPFLQNDTIGQGLYSVRKGGMERFDERNAIDMMNSVLQLIRDEVSAFSVYKKDDVTEALKKMTQQMKLLEQKTTNADKITSEEMNYVIVNPFEGATHFKAAYWITQCDEANNLRAGLSLDPLKYTTTKTLRGITLLTDTMGGRKEQKGTNAIEAYKYALTTRDRIITREDIKNFCRVTLKEELKEVEVKRGTIISDKPKEGFIRTVEIEITPTSYATYGKSYWDKMAIAIKTQIESRSIDGVTYVVRVINKD